MNYELDIQCTRKCIKPSYLKNWLIIENFGNSFLVFRIIVLPSLFRSKISRALICDAKILKKKITKYRFFIKAKNQHIVIILQYFCSTWHVLKLNDQVHTLHHQKCVWNVYLSISSNWNYNSYANNNSIHSSSTDSNTCSTNIKW